MPPISAAAVTELRLSAFRSHRGLALPLAPLTVLAGPSGSGKSAVLEAYAALARLAGGEELGQVFGEVRGGPAGCVPRDARPDRQGRRGFRLGCTVDGPAGPVRCDVAVQAEPELRVAGERLTAADGRTLLSTALRDPGRRQVHAEWHTAGTARVTRAPLPDDRLATALLPLRVAGVTDGQREVLAAAEQVVIALRAAFACDPRPEAMRAPADLADGLLRRGCENLAAVLRRTRAECGTRHAALVEAVRAGCAGPVAGLSTTPGERARVTAVLERGAGRADMPVEWLGDGELRYLALALVLLTGPGVLAVDPVREVLPARQALTVLADGLDRGMDRRQTQELLALAARMCERGHVRLLGAAQGVAEVPGGRLVDLGGERIP
ncbi:AAA family ATPase [Streptomyces sp. JJ36]|uniref:AAA family ATPase n=1 Tax=Streptomyces sp. JJ36 TaxID=2736645 RepID=UPI001F355EBF|nr:ATP-binding protein [Streptomyces sp. JJ36]MCF6522680.1 ATP-binding protein [Streptomyces sp. JJ36]